VPASLPNNKNMANSWMGIEKQFEEWEREERVINQPKKSEKQLQPPRQCQIGLTQRPPTWYQIVVGE